MIRDATEVRLTQKERRELAARLRVGSTCDRAIELFGDTPGKVRTRRAKHLLYRDNGRSLVKVQRLKAHGLDADIKHGNSIVVCPPSRGAIEEGAAGELQATFSLAGKLHRRRRAGAISHVRLVACRRAAIVARRQYAPPGR
jgi:hypothetical protein